MTELPPIIERLDALRPPKGEGLGYYKALEQWEHSVGESYDDIRAELLRLQEERDRAHRDRVGTNIAYEGSREAIHRLTEKCREAEQQRDALLEALKEIVEIGGDGVASQEARIAMQAIANMEGHDG